VSFFSFLEGKADRIYQDPDTFFNLKGDNMELRINNAEIRDMSKLTDVLHELSNIVQQPDYPSSTCHLADANATLTPAKAQSSTNATQVLLILRASTLSGIPR